MKPKRPSIHIDTVDDAIIGAIALKAGWRVYMPGMNSLRLSSNRLYMTVFGSARGWASDTWVIANAIADHVETLYGPCGDTKFIFRGGVRPAVDGRAQRHSRSRR